ncbi:MAG TPA: hypothetical protein VFC51_18515 [Chloroflexota bacterium]|nr:hypothetical protein [Chloroflexota bacterium]
MALLGPHLLYTDTNLAQVSTGAGVYALLDGDEVIFYGWSTDVPGLRARLVAHRKGNCTQKATHFQIEIIRGDRSPSERRAELLRQHLSEHGAYPRCNRLGS